MTYCVGMLVEDGLALIGDTRTNAGVDNISTYRKLHITEVPGERVLGVATAGNLSVTQTALAMVAEGLKLPDCEVPETLLTARTLFRAAQLIGQAVSQVRASLAPQMQAEALKARLTPGARLVVIGGGFVGLEA
ncbi:MAG: peptidase, partial [Brevundimonas sp.]